MYKKGGVCRFSSLNFISEKAVLFRPKLDELEVKKRRAAIEVLTVVKKYLQDQESDHSIRIVKDVLQRRSINPHVYYQALENATKTPMLLKRDPCFTCSGHSEIVEGQ